MCEHRTYKFTGVRQLSLVFILPESIGKIWWRLTIEPGLSVLIHSLPMVSFSDQTFEFLATERELGRMLIFLVSHFCFFRRYAVRTSALRKTCIMKMKNPCKEKCASLKQSVNVTLLKANEVVRSCFFYLLSNIISSISYNKKYTYMWALFEKESFHSRDRY